MHTPLIYRRRGRLVKNGLLIGLLLLLCQPGWTQGLGSYGAPSLLFSPSAVAGGLGTGLVAASTEASAIYYNPAALSRLGQIALAGNTFKLFPEFRNEARYLHLAGVMRNSATGNFWLGVAYTRTGLGEQVITGESGPEVLGKFEPYESVLALAVAAKLGQHARLGSSFKLIRVNFGPQQLPLNRQEISASAFAVDLGFLYDGFLPSLHVSRQILQQRWPWQKWAPSQLPPGFSLGVALANVGSKLEFIDAAQADPLPQNLRVGLAWNLIDTDLIGLIATGEFRKILIKTNRNGSADGALKALFSSWGDQSLRDEFSEALYTGGVEASFLQLAAIRFGRYWDGDERYGFNTFGYSIGPPALRFSFAKFSPYKSSFIDDWHVYTVSVGMKQLPF